MKTNNQNSQDYWKETKEGRVTVPYLLIFNPESPKDFRFIKVIKEKMFQLYFF